MRSTLRHIPLPCREAQAGSTNFVKEGGSFTFRFALSDGYEKTTDFAVKVNGAKVELTADDTYTIIDVREFIWLAIIIALALIIYIMWKKKCQANRKVQG